MKNGKLNTYSMQELAPIICEFLEQGKKVKILAKGNSMLPLLRNMKDKIVLTAARGDDCSVGDAVFYRRATGHYVLHRIVGIGDDGSFILMGDGQSEAETGIKACQILAKPVEFYRGSRCISCSSLGYRIYSKIWTKAVFLRSLQRLFYKLKSRIYQKFVL